MENRDNTTKNDQDMRQADGASSEQPQQSEQINIKFGKGLARQFNGKDGKQYTRISIPNRDPADKSPWAYFVVPSDRVHENKFGNGLYVKLFADAHTTVTKAERIGQRDDGKGIYENKRFSIRNTDLKARVEEYKTQDRSSVRGRLEEKKQEAHKPTQAQQKPQQQQRQQASL